MGCACTKNIPNMIAKENKLSDINPKLISVGKKIINRDKNLLNTIKIAIENNSNNKVESKLKILNPRRNFFYVIQKISWIIILDFLPYKDLCSAGQLNKFLNTVAKSQQLLKKFYKNRKSISNLNFNTQSMLEQWKIINNLPNISNHYNYTTINNFNNVDDTQLKKNSNNETKTTSINFKNIPTFHEEKEGENDSVDNNTLTHRLNQKDNQFCEINFISDADEDINYIDLFTKKVIDIKSGLTSKNKSKDSIKLLKNSIELDSSNLTPSFTLDILSRSDENSVISYDKKYKNHSKMMKFSNKKKGMKIKLSESTGKLNLSEKNSLGNKTPFKLTKSKISSRSSKSVFIF